MFSIVAISEAQRRHLYTGLERVLGPERAELLMALLPPDSSVLATKSDIEGLERGMRTEFEAVDHRFEGIDQRFDGHDRRFDRLETRIDGVNQRLDRLFLTLGGGSRRHDRHRVRRDLPALKRGPFHYRSRP
jgi:hypothetical protein